MDTLPAPPPPDPGRDALFLDFDGTLVGFADHPDAVQVPPGLAATLADLSGRMDGALALVSGRKVDSVDRQVAPLTLPVAGVHGLELRRVPGGPVMRHDGEAARLEAVRRFLAEKMDADDPIFMEDKGGAIVLHFRTAPSEAERARALAAAAARLDKGLVAVDGHAIAEIRPRAITKAGAIHHLLEAPPFRGRRPVFVGDDVTDEDGFRAVAEAGGHGIKVGAGPTAARHRLADVAAVHRWLGLGAGDQEPAVAGR